MEPEGSFMFTNVGNFSGSKTPEFEYLIVTADDFGYSAQRDNGIIESFNNGIVTRASLLVNGFSARKSAVKLAKEHGLLLGVHLNLTEGKPVTQGQDGFKSSLLTNDGFFRGKFGLRNALSRGEISMTHIEEEIKAQIQTFVEFVGYLPNHVDGHQHIQVLPQICNVIAHVMSTYSLNQIRIPHESQLSHWFKGNLDFYNKVFEDARAAMGIYSKCNIRFPKSFMGISLMGKHMNSDRIIEYYQAAKTYELKTPMRVCEFMVHPGYPCVENQGGCGEGPDEFACSTDRKYELDVLCDPELKHRLTELNVKLIS